MQLSPKKVPEKKQDKIQGLSNAQKGLYKPVWGSLVPYGKHSGRTLKWVKDNDPKYLEWMLESGTAYDWGNYTMGDILPVSRKRYDRLVTDSSIWLFLQEVESKCQAWEDIEQYEVNKQRN